jgi:hypothetical protein
MNARFVNKTVSAATATQIQEFIDQFGVTVIPGRRGRRHQTGFSNTQIFKGTYRTPVRF